LTCLIQSADRCRWRQVAIFFNIMDIRQHQRVDYFQKDTRFTHIMAEVLASVVSRTHRSNVVSKQANSSINLIVFNKGSTWQKSQLSSEVSLQTQQNHHTVWHLQTTSLWQVYMVNVCKQGRRWVCSFLTAQGGAADFKVGGTSTKQDSLAPLAKKIFVYPTFPTVGGRSKQISVGAYWIYWNLMSGCRTNKHRQA